MSGHPVESNEFPKHLLRNLQIKRLNILSVGLLPCWTGELKKYHGTNEHDMSNY